jgi:signal transduction histidine kinase
MNDMLARLDDAAVRQRQFVADASHELRTPLTAIRASLEVGLAHADTAPWPDIALRAVRQAQRLEHLIAQLLVQAKSDAAQEADRRQTVDLRALLSEIRATTLAPGISISIGIPPETVTAGHPDELTRMFRNLVDNAARYAKSSVIVSAVPRPGSIAVEITDDGPGIPAAQRQRVFDRFVRLDPSRGHVSGSAGLGLAIARRIATAHQASIELTEAASGGVRAVVTLPARPCA